MSGQYDFKSDDRRRCNPHNTIMEAATMVLRDYNRDHEGNECSLIKGTYDGQLTHKGHIPIFIEDNSIHLYGEKDEDNELIVEEIVKRCKKDGLDVEILYD